MELTLPEITGIITKRKRHILYYRKTNGKIIHQLKTMK